MGRRRVSPSRYIQEKRRIARREFLTRFFESLRERLRKHYSERSKLLRTARRLALALSRKRREEYKERAKQKVTVPLVIEFPKKYNTLAIDRILLSLPVEDRNNIINILKSISVQRGILPNILQQVPGLLWFISTVVPFYSRMPCKHNAFAVKVTPVLRGSLAGTRAAYYVLRYAKAEDAKADPYLGRAKAVDWNFTMVRYKPDPDWWNALVFSGEGTMDLNDTVALARDAFRNPTYQVPLRRAILQPHWVKVAFAKEMGQPEKYLQVDHCSEYAVLERIPKQAFLYRQPRRDLLGRRQRHRIKDILYMRGVRI